MNCALCQGFDAAPTLARCLTCQNHEYYARGEAQPLEGVSPQERLPQEAADVFGAEGTCRAFAANGDAATKDRL